jgi:hypothetical protein
VLEALDVAPDDSEASAGPREAQGDRCADPGAAACHDRVAIFHRVRKQKALRSAAWNPPQYGVLPTQQGTANLDFLKLR